MTVIKPARIPATFLLIAAGIFAAPAGLEFETATVKVHPMAPGNWYIKNFPHAPPFVIPTGNTYAETLHAQELVMEAYGINGYQILYLPSWAFSERGIVYDVEAKAPGDAKPTPEQIQQMLQALLADRFHLKAHHETKKLSLNALVVDKGGPKFHEAEKGGTTLFALARFLTPLLDYPVVDRTGLHDVPWDFDIDKMVSYHEIDRDEGADPLEASDYLRTAVQHQLGLRLESRKENTDVLVIDHIEEPRN